VFHILIGAGGLELCLGWQSPQNPCGDGTELNPTPRFENKQF